MDGITEIINNYNTENNYQDNSSTVNYYIGSFDDDGNLTDYYSPSLYDEETLVFTEPVTGAQYQTTGWTYDYTTRSYDIDLESGTFAIGDADITRILCTYGDEAVTIAYYDSGGTAVQSDEYAYVLVASNSCAINGHSYTVETTKESTCTSAGERLYTCSTCGDQYVEDVPMKEHSYTFSIMKEPSCISSGLGIYTCSGCGMQYTETIPAEEHTGVLIESVPTVYGDSGTVITVGYSVYECSTCGTQYTIYDETPSSGSSTGFWERLMDAFTDALASIIESALSLDLTGSVYCNTLFRAGKLGPARCSV